MFFIGYSQKACENSGYGVNETAMGNPEGGYVFATRQQAEKRILDYCLGQYPAPVDLTDWERSRDEIELAEGTWGAPSYARRFERKLSAFHMYFFDLLARFEVKPAPVAMIEREAMRCGCFETPIWEKAPCAFFSRGAYPTHFTRRSEKDSRLIEFYASESDLERGRLTSIKPGRYLAKFFPNATKEQVEFWATWQTTGDKPLRPTPPVFLHFAKTPDEIVSVYTDSRVISCMDGRNFDRERNPVRVYGAGTLAIAALGLGTSLDDIHKAPADWRPLERRLCPKARDIFVARALVNPETKTYGRIYPTAGNEYSEGYDRDTLEALRDKLQAELRALGYVSIQENRTGFDNAPLVLEWNGSRVAMPYLDDVGFCYEGGKLFLHSADQYSGESTSGWYSVDGSSHDEDEDEPYYDWTCDHCEEGQYDTDTSYTVYRNAQMTGSRQYCEHCVQNNAWRCEYSDEYYANNVDPVSMNNGEYWSPRAFADHGFNCHITGENYPNHEGQEIRTVTGARVWACDDAVNEECVEFEGLCGNFLNVGEEELKQAAHEHAANTRAQDGETFPMIYGDSIRDGLQSIVGALMALNSALEAAKLACYVADYPNTVLAQEYALAA